MKNRNSNVLAIDFETTEVAFFDKKNRKAINWSGHPRLAKALIVSFKNATSGEATEEISLNSIPSSECLIFHNATFDIQVGINAGVWNEFQFS